LCIESAQAEMGMGSIFSKNGKGLALGGGLMAPKAPLLTGLAKRRQKLLDSEGLTAFLKVEQRRAKRSGKAFVVLLVNVDAPRTGSSGDLKVGGLAAALSSSIRDTDVIGWYQDGAIVGIVFTEIPLENRDKVSLLLLTKIASVVREALGVQRSAAVYQSISFLEPDTPGVNLRAVAQRTASSGPHKNTANADELSPPLLRPEPIT
jgi:hypothetical protein